jgi:hypothetical protein
LSQKARAHFLLPSGNRNGVCDESLRTPMKKSSQRTDCITIFPGLVVSLPRGTLERAPLWRTRPRGFGRFRSTHAATRSPAARSSLKTVHWTVLLAFGQTFLTARGVGLAFLGERSELRKACPMRALASMRRSSPSLMLGASRPRGFASLSRCGVRRAIGCRRLLIPAHPLPNRGILVAITVRKGTLDSSGSPAI